MLLIDAYALVKRCDKCQMIEHISKKNEMSLNSIFEVEIFNIWDIDFMGPFLTLYGQ